MPDDRLGERVAAVLQLRDGLAGAAVPDIQRCVRDLLAGYKVPKSVWLAIQTGRIVSGKADYAWAREYVRAHPPDLAPEAP